MGILARRRVESKKKSVVKEAVKQVQAVKEAEPKKVGRPKKDQ